MKKSFFLYACAFLLSFCLCTNIVQACAPELTFRAYLDKRFWQPLSKYEKDLETASAQRGESHTRTKSKRKTVYIFAGTSSAPATPAMMEVRKAYQEGKLERAAAALHAASEEAATESEKEELALLDAKITLRRGEAVETGDGALLQEAQAMLRTFLENARIPSWRSEARGWLARAHYLLEEYSQAAKIYLDELERDDSVYSRDTLVTSLRIIFPYNGSSKRLADHLEEYFDTPGHALFVVTIVTNPVYNDAQERKEMAAVAQKTMDALLKHRELFNTGPLSDQLALALMRASIYRGDTAAALSYSQLINKTSQVAESPEFNWMVASSRFLRKEYREAEAPLSRIINSNNSTARDRNAASQGLIGVYQKTGQRVEQLHAAFLYEKYAAREEDENAEDVSAGEPYVGFNYWPLGGWLFDLPYLLDVQLTDVELLQYLDRYGNESRSINLNLQRKRTAYEAVRYALAVRYARQEKYLQAAKIYEEINARPRAKRMREVARLHADALSTSNPPQKRLEALFAYASFLESNSTRIFFNDMLWGGFQTWSFIKPYAEEVLDRFSYNSGGGQGLTCKERELFVKLEREIRDDQEERWRAYGILNDLVEKTGHTDLGRRAAVKALRCLQLINSDRFGRQEEIAAAQRRLIKWLKENT
jgi:hypothetical protein